MDEDKKPSGLLSSVTATLARPFREDMDAKDWLLFTGLIMVCALFWSLVLRAVIDTVE